MDNKELLAVLDMSEYKQIEWLIMNSIYYKCTNESLADFAFRLRDEAVESLGEVIWHKAVVIVCGYMWKETAWFKNYAKPIHWIIAALIAKNT